jgi:hypothetical protein
LRQAHDYHEAPLRRNRPCLRRRDHSACARSVLLQFLRGRRAIFPSELENPARLIEKGVQNRSMERADFWTASQPREEGGLPAARFDWRAFTAIALIASGFNWGRLP